MKSEKLLDLIGEIDDSIVAEADSGDVENRPMKHSWIKWASVAAAACLLIAITFALNQSVLAGPANPAENTGLPMPVGNGEPDEPVSDSGLPLLVVNDEFGAFGYEGHMAFHIDELEDGISAA